MSNTSEITSVLCIIDSRDIQERIDYLKSLGDEADEIDKEELATLNQLKEDADASKWEFGVTFIRDSYFENYTQELCEDIGDVPRGFPSYIVIDWERTAENIKIDYTTVDFGGETYWYR